MPNGSQATADAQDDIVDDFGDGVDDTSNQGVPENGSRDDSGNTQTDTSKASTGDYDFGDPAADDTPADDSQADDSTPGASNSGSDLDDATVKLGEQYGYSADDMKAFGSKSAALAAMAAIDRQIAALGRGQQPGSQPQNQQGQQQQQQTQANQPGQQTQAPPAGATGQQPAKAEGQQVQQQQSVDRPFEKLKLELDPNDFDEDSIKVLNSINDHYDSVVSKQQQQIEQLTNVVSQFVTQAQTSEQQRTETEIEDFFAGLGKDFEDVFGKGKLSDLDQNSIQRKQRMDFVAEVGALMRGDKAAGRQQQPLKAYLDRATRVFAPTFEKLKSQTRKEVTQTVNRRRNLAVAKPTNRQGKPLTPEEKAGARVDQFYRDRGMDPGTDETPDEI